MNKTADLVSLQSEVMRHNLLSLPANSKHVSKRTFCRYFNRGIMPSRRHNNGGIGFVSDAS